MEVRSVHKFLRLSPSKIRPVVAVIKKMSPAQAVASLPFIGKRASVPLAKAIKAAIAGAKDRGISEDKLKFKEIQIGEGPRLKRGIAVSRGRWHPIAKRMSHIRIVLETVKEVKKEIKKNGTKN